MQKYCNKCGRLKKFSAFHRDSNSKDGTCSRCKKCEQAGRRTEIGHIKKMYRGQKTNSKVRKEQPPTYTQEELVEWCVEQPLYFTLHRAWEASNYSKELAPSCDRIDDYKSYTLDNIQLVTWVENRKKYHKDAIAGINNKQSKIVHQFDKNSNNFVREYHSTHEASRQTGINRQNICKCANGALLSAGGFKWSFKIYNKI